MNKLHRRSCGIGRVSSRPFVVHPALKSGEPVVRKVCPASWFMRTHMDGINGARPVRHRKQKRQARRRNTRPVAAHLRRLKQGKNDLLLAEFSALGTSGVELARWFSAKRPEIKVLVASDWLWEVESC